MTHVLVIDDTENNGWTFECPGQPACSGWEECRDPAGHEGFDPEDEDSPAFDEYEDVEIHGVFHEWQWGYGWTVPFVGCVVDENGCDLPYELWDREQDRYKPGRWIVNDDWDDTDCTLILVGPEGGE